MKTALVLGAGGARGLAHIGVIKVLEQEGFQPDLIVGSSIGAIIGGMYAQTRDIRWVEHRVREFFESHEYADLRVDVLERHGSDRNENDFLHQIARNLVKRVLLNMIVSRQSILRDDRLGQAMGFLLKSGDIRETEIPFACVATDLVKGQPVLFTEGDIQLAVKASSSIPGYLPPVPYNSCLLVDGAVAYSLPINYAYQLGADRVIAVDVRQRIKPQDKFENVFDILFRSSAVTAEILCQEIAARADVLLQPDVGNYLWYDFQKMNDLIQAGEDAAYQKLTEIRQHIGLARKAGLLGWLAKKLKKGTGS